MRTVALERETMRMKKQTQELIAEAPRRNSKVEMTIGIDLGDVWSHYCTLNQEGEVVDWGRFRTTLARVERWFTDLPPVRIAMEAGTHSIWISRGLGGQYSRARKKAPSSPQTGRSPIKMLRPSLWLVEVQMHLEVLLPLLSAAVEASLYNVRCRMDARIVPDNR
jgi:hypothetical protein